MSLGIAEAQNIIVKIPNPAKNSLAQAKTRAEAKVP
jgi:hypothetical protein